MPPERDIDIYPRRISFPGSLPSYSMSNKGIGMVSRWQLLEDASFQDRADWGMMTATHRHMLEKKLSEFLFQEAEVLKQRIFHDSVSTGPWDPRDLSGNSKTNPGKISIGSSTLKPPLII